MEDKLSVSIVVYGKYDEALETVQSIEQHTNEQIRKKIYIIDNSCRKEGDHERGTFIEAVKEYSDVAYVDTGSNLGFGKGHNYTINSIKSEYHAIVNPDILLEEDAFSSLINYMDKAPSIGMCIPKLIDAKGNLQDAYRREPTVLDLYIRMFTKKAFAKRRDYHSMKDQDYSKPFRVPFGQGSFLLIRTSLWKKLGGFDDRFFMYMEDADLCRRVNETSCLMYYPYAKVQHKWEKESHRNLKLFKIHTQSMAKYFNKWGWKFY